MITETKSAIRLPFDTLRILLSQYDAKVVRGTRCAYHWPCGCSAAGHDPDCLDVLFCEEHAIVVRALTPRPAT